MKTKKFNGKPMSHWQKLADKLVIEHLISCLHFDQRSIIVQLATKRLLELSVAENPRLTKQVLKERESRQVGFVRVMNEILGR